MVAPVSPQLVSDRKLMANRRNARRSTGPVTPEGKQRSSLNALQHGLRCADQLILPGESRAEMLILRQEVIQSLRPQDAMQLMLVERIVNARWKLDRLHRLEQTRHEQAIHQMHVDAANRLAELEDLLLSKDVEVDFSPWYRDLRQQTDNPDPASHRKFGDVEEIKNEARRLVQMIEQLQADRLPVEQVQGMQLSSKEGSNEFDRHGRYEQRLENSILRCSRELSRLQQMKSRYEWPKSPYESEDKDLNDLAEQEIEHQKSPNEPTEESSDASDGRTRGWKGDEMASVDQTRSELNLEEVKQTEKPPNRPVGPVKPL